MAPRGPNVCRQQRSTATYYTNCVPGLLAVVLKRAPCIKHSAPSSSERRLHVLAFWQKDSTASASTAATTKASARVTAAALYEAQYDEMHAFTLKLTGAAGVPIAKRSCCRLLRDRRVLKLNTACSTLSWTPSKSAQLCEVTAVGRSRCAVTLALPKGGVSLVLPSTLDAELLESLLLTLCAAKSSSNSSSKRGSATCSSKGSSSSGTQ
jgi:hypothetical protein